MKRSKLLNILFNLFTSQNPSRSRRGITRGTFHNETVFQKLRKIAHRRHFGIFNSYSEPKDIINYITTRNMRKTIIPSDFKNIPAKFQMNAGNIKYILHVISQNIKKSKQLIFLPPVTNILKFHSRSSQWGSVISKESQGDIKTNDENPELWGGPESFKLIKLLKEDIDNVINNTPDVIIFFYAYWCPHCLRLKRVYGKAALMAKQAGLNMLFAAFDVTINPDLAEEKGVVGIPAIRYYKNGKFVTVYKGKRTIDDLFDFVKNPPQPPPVVTRTNI